MPPLRRLSVSAAGRTKGGYRGLAGIRRHRPLDRRPGRQPPTISRSGFIPPSLFFFSYVLPGSFPGRSNRPRMLWLVPLGLAAGLFLLDWVVFDQRFLRRLQFIGTVHDIRPQLWRTAWEMFSYSPLLGVGLGRFYALFPVFYPGPPEAWRQFNVNRGNAHSIYIQPLAEQGILGFLSFLLLIGVILTIAFKMLKGETEKERLWLGLSITIALITWLTLGLFHHIANDLRSLEIFFWIFSGFLLVLARRTAAALRPGKKIVVGIIIGLTAALAYQVKLIASYPLGEHFQVGFYHWENQADGSRIRWMGQRAAAILPPGRNELILELRAPLPEVEQRPQRVQIRLDQRTYALTLADREWRRLALPLSANGARRHSDFAGRPLIPLIPPGPSAARTRETWGYNSRTLKGNLSERPAGRDTPILAQLLRVSK